MRNKDGNCRKSDDEVDDIFYKRPLTEEKIDDIPIAAHKVTDGDEAPIETADDKEEKRNGVKCFHRMRDG